MRGDAHQSQSNEVRQLPFRTPSKHSACWHGRVSLGVNAEDGGVRQCWLQRGGFRGRPEGAGEEMVHRHTGVTHPPRRKVP